ncbi:MAG: hypothetical protein LAN37_03980 [Acidobacteriia bacterium]|nr:hypothetical protein [Terriglobia bacterium]
MFCPFCHTDYDDDAPCFCHPPSQRNAAASDAKRIVALPDVPKPPEPPAGLDNPFWRPEATMPVAIPLTPNAKRIAPLS